MKTVTLTMVDGRTRVASADEVFIMQTGVSLRRYGREVAFYSSSLISSVMVVLAIE